MQKSMCLTMVPISHAKPTPNHNSSRSQRKKQAVNLLEIKVVRTTLSTSAVRPSHCLQGATCFTDLLLILTLFALVREAGDGSFYRKET